MWSGFLNKKDKKSIYGETLENGDDEELNPMLSHNSASDSFFSNYENANSVEETSVAQTGMAQTYVQQTHTKPIAQNTSMEGIDINLDSIDEFTKITDNIYVCNCVDISTDFVQSIGFNSVINISSQKNILPHTNSASNNTKYMNITLENIKSTTTQTLINKFITDGLRKPKVLLNFENINIMAIVSLHYIYIHKLTESTFIQKYDYESLPNEYLHMLYNLVPDLDKFRTNENFSVFVDMFPDIPRHRLEKLYKDSGGNIEYAVSMIFS